MIARSSLRPVLVVVGVLLVMALPGAWVIPAYGLPVGSAVAPSLATAHAGSTTASVHPLLTCPVPFPTFGALGTPGAYPLIPDQLPQYPCPKIAVDEVHASFASSTSGSGARWTIPVHLPTDGSVTYQADSYPQFYVGMVVGGDGLSEWRQSFAAVVFAPQGTPVSSYQESVHVFSLVNTSHTSCSIDEITWNGSFYCVQDDLASGSIASSTPAPGDWLNVTFAGTVGGSAGLDLWVNDSTTTADTTSAVLSSTNTGSDTFEPFYSAACVDACMVQWSVKSATGLGVGFLMCPFSAPQAACDSYNDTRFNNTNPVEFGIPHFWTGSSYEGDYRYFAPQSTSGVCNGAAASGTLTYCYNQNVFGGDGYYPSFSYNGTLLDWGVPRAWTTQDWGGTVFQLLSTAAPNDLTPFYFHAIHNDSRAGFVRTGAALNVSTDLQDIGNVRYAGVTYSVNSGPPTSIAMHLANGTRNDGNWTVEIPVGPNGWINYTINATNNASAQILTPAAGTSYHVQRGPLPNFAVRTESSLGACGGVKINGTLYTSGQSPSFLPGTYPILGVGCYPWLFAGWTLSAGISIQPTGEQSGLVSISAAGNITDTWRYVKPLDTIDLYTTPTNCGGILLNGSSWYPTGTGIKVQLIDDTNYSLSATGCGGYSFAGWNLGGNFTVLGTVIVLHGNGTLTANFVSSTAAFTIIFATNPSTCGGIAFEGAGYTNGETLAELAGTYPIAPDPCFHWGFSAWSTSGSSLSISNNNLTVSGSGTITETNYVLTIVTFATSPPSCGSIQFDGSTFVNGQWVSVANDSTHSVYATPCAGYYLFAITGNGGSIGVTVTGNLAVVNGSGTITATFLKGSPTNFVGFLTDPSTCGWIYLSGIKYASSNYTYVATGSQASVAAQPCNGYGFLSWVTFGGITITNSTAYINGPGAIEAVFRPLATVFVYTSPLGCGTVNIANVSYASNSSIQLVENKPYSLTTTPCAGRDFSSWVNSSGALINGHNVTLTSGAVLTAIFLPVRFTVTVDVSPAKCGGVRIGGQDVGNGSSLILSLTTYSIVPTPCAGDHLVNWDLTANLAVVNTTLWVNGSGTITAIYQPVPPTVTLYVATSSFAGIAVPFGATVAVPVPPYTYNYTWSFGDGSPETTPVNFTSHTYANPGRYTVTVHISDPYNRTANSTATIQIVPATALGTAGLTTLSLAAIGLAVVAVLAVIVIGSRLRRPPAEPTPSLMPPNAPSSPDEMPALTTGTEMEAPKP